MYHWCAEAQEQKRQRHRKHRRSNSSAAAKAARLEDGKGGLGDEDGDAGLEWRQRHAEIVTAYGKLWEVVSVAGYGVAVKCGSPACSNSSSAAKAARLEDGKGVSGDEDGDAGLEWRQRRAEIVTAYGKIWEVVSVAGQACERCLHDCQARVNLEVQASCRLGMHT